MAKIKLSDPVTVSATGEVTTIKQLAAEGHIEFSEVTNFGRTGRTAYFADIKGTSSGWEINKTAWLSRTGQEINF